MERLEFIPSSAYWVTESGWSRKLYAGRRVRARGSAGSGGWREIRAGAPVPKWISWEGRAWPEGRTGSSVQVTLKRARKCLHGQSELPDRVTHGGGLFCSYFICTKEYAFLMTANGDGSQRYIAFVRQQLIPWCWDISATQK